MEKLTTWFEQRSATLLLSLIMSMVGINAFAHDIEVANADGVTIYYKFINNQTELSVSFRGDYFYSYSNEYTGSVVIPESVTYNGTTYAVTSISDYAFRFCTGLTSVTIQNSVTSFGYGAFYGCIGLTSVTIPNSVTSIGDFAFFNCSGLTSITIPNSVTSINRSAFSQCSSLTSVTIPNSVTSIGREAFAGCSGLTSVTIPNSVTSIGSSAFSGCSGLTSITIPNSVTSIGYYAFQFCTGLTSVTIPNSVTSINSYTFYNCSGLTSITIPESVTSIAGDAFSGCDNIMEVKSKILKPFNADAFSESTYRNGTLYIPQGTMSLYTRFDGWRNFLNIQEEAADGEPKFLTLNIAGNGVLLQQIELGKSYSFRIVPDEGWRINAVVYNGEDVTAQLSSDNMYETPAINDNATLVVSFENVVPDAIRAEERKSAVRVYASEGSIVVRDGCIGSELTVYDMQGRCMVIDRITEHVQKISLPPSSVYIVKTEGKTIKVGL